MAEAFAPGTTPAAQSVGRSKTLKKLREEGLATGARRAKMTAAGVGAAGLGAGGYGAYRASKKK